MTMTKNAIVIVTLFVTCLVSHPTFAQTSVWNGGTNGVWHAGGWSSGIPGVQNSLTAQFQQYPGQTTVMNVTSSVPVTFNGINVTNNNILDLRLNGFGMMFTSNWQLGGRMLLSGGSIVAPNIGFTSGSILELSSGGTVTSNSISSNAAGSVMLHSGGTMTLNLSSVLSMSPTSQLGFVFDGGTLNAASGLRLESGANLSGYGIINAPFQGLASSKITVTGGTLLIGSSSPSGFEMNGNVVVNSGRTLRVNDSNFATFRGQTDLLGGTIETVNGAVGAGLTFTGGASLIGSGTINGRVNADVGSSIQASGGNLTIGNLSKLSLFSAGDLHTGDHTVTLLGTNRATLGSLTSLGSASSGILDVDRGAFMDFGRMMVGYGTVDSINTLSNAMIINGDVIGNSVLDRITFEGYVKGLGTFTNVTMNGTFSPGLSPSFMFTNNLSLGSNAVLEMEIGGMIPGAEYDKLIDSALLHLDGTLKLTLFDGFNPNIGDEFDILDWVSLSGGFSNFDLSLAGLDPGAYWDLSDLHNTGVVRVLAIPEPGLAGLLISLISVVAASGRTKRRKS